MAYIRTTKQFMAMIKQARIDQGLTQEQLARKVGMTQKKIAMLENLAASPRLDVLLQLTSVLGLNLSLETEHKPDKKIQMVWE